MNDESKAVVNRRTPGASRGRVTFGTRGSVWSAVSLAPLFRAGGRQRKSKVVVACRTLSNLVAVIWEKKMGGERQRRSIYQPGVDAIAATLGKRSKMSPTLKGLNRRLQPLQGCRIGWAMTQHRQAETPG